MPFCLQGQITANWGGGWGGRRREAHLWGHIANNFVVVDLDPDPDPDPERVRNLLLRSICVNHS
jgi:hypothetical protein